MTEDHASNALLYEAGELPPADAAGFEAHLRTCAECRGVIDLARRGHAWGRALAEGPAPETLGAVFVRPAATAWFPVLRLGAAAGLACAALAGVVFLQRPAPDLSWESDIPVRIRALQQRLGESRASADALRTKTDSWE